jgi:uroporphyrinogen III methyltransferase/synthase
MRKGKVYLVGAGPGRPDLITIRGLNILKEADVVIYDYLVDRQLLEYAKDEAELVCCDKLAKKDRYSDRFRIHQEKINNLLIKKAREGKKVVRLKNGDPSIFGRFSQELGALVKEKIKFELIPGVTAATAASCLSGIPLTDRRFASSCVFVTGQEDSKKKTSLLDWDSLAKTDTVVLYMAVDNLGEVIKQLLKSGKDKDTPCVVVKDASLTTQKVITGILGNIVSKAKHHKIRPPAIIIIGEVVKLEKKFNWLKKHKRILFTGLSRERFFIEGIYFHLPLIKIEPLEDYREFDNYLRYIREFDWIIFTSRYGVYYFFERLKKIGLDSRMLNGIKVAAVGNSTANKLLDLGIIADLIPHKESSEGLVKKFRELNLRSKRIFLPRSDISDKGLKQALERLGAEVVTSFAYRNVMPKDLPDLNLSFFDEIMFTSPSTVRNFKKRYKEVPQGVKIKCIGEVTNKELSRQFGNHIQSQKSKT